MRCAIVARMGAALAISCALAPTVALAQSSMTYVAWSPNVISIRAAIGAENDISFGPGEQITYASVDDAQRWDAHEAAPIIKDGATFERVAITPSERSTTNLLVRTSERTYRIRLFAVTSAPSQVAFLYPRAFISRDPLNRPPAAGANYIPQPQAAVTGDVLPAGSANPSVAYIPPGTLPAGPPVADLRALSLSKCVKSGGGAQMRTAKYLAQGANAIAVAKAVRNHAVSNAVFGLHSLLYYAATFAVEDFAVSRATKNACPRTKTLIDFGMAAAAGYNAAVTPSR